MKAGDLRHLITIEQPAEGVPDSRARRTVTWKKLTEMYAAVRDVSGREFYQAAAYQMENVITFATRHNALISTKHRIRWRGNVYEILQINHLGYAGDYMQIRARIIEAEAAQ